METQTKQGQGLKQQVLDFSEEADEWGGNLTYLLDEARFFKRFIEGHLSGIDTEITEKTVQFQKVLSELEVQLHQVRDEVALHREMLEALLKNLSAAELNATTERHDVLRSRFYEIDKQVREFKKQFYDVTEDI